MKNQGFRGLYRKKENIYVNLNIHINEAARRCSFMWIVWTIKFPKGFHRFSVHLRRP